MVLSYLSLGSNDQRETRLHRALSALAQSFRDLQVSPVYESEALGFHGKPFLNLVVAIHHNLCVRDLNRVLRDIEEQNGRCRDHTHPDIQPLDIDLLTYGDQVGVLEGVLLPRPEILTHAYVLRPLAELAPDAQHPESQIRYADLWQQFADAEAQPLWRVELA